MSNTFGSKYKVTTYGESHGVAIGGVIDGCPAGLAYDAEMMAHEMARRHEGARSTTRHSRGVHTWHPHSLQDSQQRRQKRRLRHPQGALPTRTR